MPEPKRHLNIAMIGNGFIARAHSNAFHQVRHFFDVPFELCTKLVCGRSRARLEAFASQWGWEEISTEWQNVISRADIDVVDIAVPNALHAPIAIAAAQAGKMIWCEKPLAVSVLEAEQITKFNHGRPSLVWFNYRRVPAVSLAKRLLDEGRIGQVFHYRSHYFNQSGVDPAKGKTWRYQKQQAGSGALGDLLSHSLDTATYLNGEIAELCASAHTFVPGREVDDAIMLMVHFKNGALGTFEASRFGVGHRNANGFELYGAKGSMAFDLEDMNRLRFFDAQDAPALQAWRNVMVTGPEHPYWQNFWKPGHLIGYEHTFIATLGDFLHDLHRNLEFHPNLSDALEVQKLLARVQASSDSSCWVKV